MAKLITEIRKELKLATNSITESVNNFSDDVSRVCNHHIGSVTAREEVEDLIKDLKYEIQIEIDRLI